MLFTPVLWREEINFYESDISVLDTTLSTILTWCLQSHQKRHNDSQLTYQEREGTESTKRIRNVLSYFLNLIYSLLQNNWITVTKLYKEHKIVTNSMQERRQDFFSNCKIIIMKKVLDFTSKWQGLKSLCSGILKMFLQITGTMQDMIYSKYKLHMCCNNVKMHSPLW